MLSQLFHSFIWHNEKTNKHIFLVLKQDLQNKIKLKQLAHCHTLAFILHLQILTVKSTDRFKMQICSVHEVAWHLCACQPPSTLIHLFRYDTIGGAFVSHLTARSNHLTESSPGIKERMKVLNGGDPANNGGSYQRDTGLWRFYWSTGWNGDTQGTNADVGYVTNHPRQTRNQE